MLSPHTLELLAGLQDVIMGSTLVRCAATDVGLQWACWALAAALKTEKFYDLAGNVEDVLLFTDLLLTAANWTHI